MELKVIKTDNIIEDICIANGLCSILEYNEIEYILRNKKSMISIEVEEFDIEELIFSPLTIEETWNIYSSLTTKDNVKLIKNVSDFITENLINIFKYYLTQDESYLTKDMKHTIGAVGIGNCYHTLSIRASTSAEALNIPTYKRYLSYVGWIKSCSYFKTDDIEITTLLIPKETNRVYKPFYFTKKDDNGIETPSNFKKGIHTNLMAYQYIRTLLNEYSVLNQQYEEILVMSWVPTENKPIVGEQYKIKIVNWSNDLLQQFLNQLSISKNTKKDIEVSNYTAKYILNTNYYNFSKLIKMYSKKNIKLKYEFEKELLNMYDDEIKLIHNNETVKKLGLGLSRLLYKKKGFEIQAQLYNTSNGLRLQKCINRILNEYERVFKTPLLNDEEFLEVINLIKNQKDAYICATAISSFSKVFVDFKTKNKNESK